MVWGDMSKGAISAAGLAEADLAVTSHSEGYRYALMSPLRLVIGAIGRASPVEVGTSRMLAFGS